MVAAAGFAQTGPTEEEKAAVRHQLERMLADPHFSHSRRFPSFLRFIVEQTLSGHADSLKERTLGIGIFGKNGDYDTVSDPIVRVTAAEIRKRIAQYYQEAGHENELRLSLSPGSYIPQFHWPQRDQPETPSLPATPPYLTQFHRVQETAWAQSSEEEVQHLPIEIPRAAIAAPAAPASRRRLSMLAGVAAGVILCVLGFLGWKAASGSPVKTFWAPVLASGDPVLLCLADQTEYRTITLRDANNPSIQHTLPDNLTAILIDDLGPLAKFAGILQSGGKKYRVLGEGSTTLADLRNGPDVLVGAYDNAWTLRMTRPLRFHFANNPDMMRFSIVDSSSHPTREWTLDRAQQLATNIYRDYAIVARFTDNTTGRVTIVSAGIARGGTIAAGEFLTNPVLLQRIERLPGYSSKKNVELVLSTQIIGGEPGTPHIEASYFW